MLRHTGAARQQRLRIVARALQALSVRGCVMALLVACAHPVCCSALRRYIYAGGFPYDLTEGDLLAVFSQARRVVLAAWRKPY